MTAPVAAAVDARCADCGLPYTDPSWADFVVSDPTWKQLTEDGARLLCVGCMVARASALGVDDASARFTSGPFVPAALAAPQAQQLAPAEYGATLNEAIGVEMLSRPAPADAVERDAMHFAEAFFAAWPDDSKIPHGAASELAQRFAAALAALSTDSAKDGWVLVPREPTKEMCEAAESLPAIHAIDDLPLAEARWTAKAVMNLKRWRQMLAAAPQADDGGKNG